MVDTLGTNTSAILAANEKDLEGLAKDGDRQTYRQAIERVRITEETIEHMAQRLLDFLAYPDPIGEISQAWMTPDGLQVHTMRAPLGVLAVISDMGPIITV